MYIAPGGTPPERQLFVQWKKQDKEPTELNYKVQLIGAKPPRDYFWIRIPTENHQTEDGTLCRTIEIRMTYKCYRY